MSWVWRPRMSVYHWCERAALRTKMLTWSRDTGLRDMSHSPAVRIEPGKVYSINSTIAGSALEHAVRRAGQALDGQPVAAGAPARLGGARQAGGGVVGEQGVLAPRQRHVPVVDGVHPGAQHLADLHPVRAGAQAILASVATLRSAIHLDVPLEERKIVARRRLPARGPEVLVDRASARHGDDQRVHVAAREHPAEGRLREGGAALLERAHVVEARPH